MAQDTNKILIGGGLLAVAAYLILRPKTAKAQTRPAVPAAPPAPPPAPALPQSVPSPAGGPVAPASTFNDPATGVKIEGPSTKLAAPAPGTPDAIKTLDRGESWSNIASRAYGDFRWWPYLWDHNRSGSNQFNNPDVLRRGDTIKIPQAPPADEGFKAAIFARAAAHRRYWLNKNAGRRVSMPPEVAERTPLPEKPAQAAPAAPPAASTPAPSTLDTRAADAQKELEAAVSSKGVSGFGLSCRMPGLGLYRC